MREKPGSFLLGAEIRIKLLDGSSEAQNEPKNALFSEKELPERITRRKIRLIEAHLLIKRSFIPHQGEEEAIGA